MDFEIFAVGTVRQIGAVSRLTSLFEAGLPCLHLRKEPGELYSLADFIKEIPVRFHNRLVIHTEYELAPLFRIRGIHFTEKTKPDLPAILKDETLARLQFSASFHSLEELKNNTFPFRYVFLSPVFDSISKLNHPAAFNEEDLEDFLKNHSQHPTQIMALGGVNRQRIPQLRTMGFDGAAVCGALWQNPEGLQEWEMMKALC